MDIWKKFKALFKAAEESSPANPLLREAIQRSSADLQAYGVWKESLAKHRLLDWINAEYLNYLHEYEEHDEAIDFLDIAVSKGFVVHFRKSRHQEEDFQHLFDYLKEQVIQQDYTCYMSDLRTYCRKTSVETIQRHYLKPRINFQQTDSQLNQLYGNITIELLFRDEKTINLKFSATGYRDRLYQPTEAFKDLMSAVLL